MAVNESRSMNRDLSEGMTDGSYKKRDGSQEARGGDVETTTDRRRDGMVPDNLLADWYGLGVEAYSKTRPDGRRMR